MSVTALKTVDKTLDRGEPKGDSMKQTGSDKQKPSMPP